MIRIIETDGPGVSAVQIPLLNLVYVRNARIPDILTPGENPNAALLRNGYDCFKDVDIAMVRRLGVLDDRVLVVLGVRRSVITAMEMIIVVLDPMVRKRMILQLPARNAVAIREGRDEERINSRTLLENVDDLLSSLIQERDGANLDSDHRLGPKLLRRRSLGALHLESSCSGGRSRQEVAAIQVEWHSFVFIAFPRKRFQIVLKGEFQRELQDAIRVQGTRDYAR